MVLNKKIKVSIFICTLFLFAKLPSAYSKSIPNVQIDKISQKSLSEDMIEIANLIFELQTYSTSIDKFGDPAAKPGHPNPTPKKEGGA